MRVAMRRAAHQILDHPRVLEDPLAVAIIGQEAGAKLSSEDHRSGKRIGRGIRAFMVARSRYAEDQLALAVARGVRQYVILGAGLDTFPYRNPYPKEALAHFRSRLPCHARMEAAPARRSGNFDPVDASRMRPSTSSGKR